MRKLPKQEFILTEQKTATEVVSSPVNEEKYAKWKEDMYFKNESGYYTDIVVGFRFYYTEEQLRAEYMQLKRWCEEKDGVYKHFYGQHNCDKYL
jgi:hypothetical protein